MPSLAVRYRPRNLSEVHGQAHIVMVLEALIQRYFAGEIQLPPGFIFSGSWGSGKTSTARILAAALNCDADVTRPCGDCGPCDEIIEGNHDAVIEIDGATSGLVDNIRNLSQIVQTMHTGRVRVVIIDECQAMSPEAFSALLKQLEEPIRDVIYIMVTTDFHKVPRTIISRCLRFSFLPLAETAVLSRLRQIAQQEGIVSDDLDEVLTYITKRSHGAMRDAVMMLEHLSIFQGFNLDVVRQLWPDVPLEFAERFMRSVGQSDFQEGVAAIGSAFAVVRDSRPLFDALSNYLRQRALQTQNRDNARRIADLIMKLWDFQLYLRNANAADPAVLEGLWFVFHGMLAKASGAIIQVNQTNKVIAVSEKDVLKRLTGGVA